MLATVAVRQACAPDWPHIEALLESAALPTTDLGPASMHDFRVALEAGGIVGAIGIERLGDDGLLRSLVVDAAWRGRGVGRALVEAAESVATARGLRSLTLLTQTASPWFRELGYHDIARAAAPAALAASSQFTYLCPGSSTCLTKALSVTLKAS